MITIRALTPQDFEAKAQVHAQTWHETYRGMMPDALVDRITPEFALQVTKRHYPDLPTLLAFESEDDGAVAGVAGGVRHGSSPEGAVSVRPRPERLVGFAEYSDPARPPSDDLGAAELDSIYVLVEAQGLGAGRALMEAVLDAVRSDRLVLWALEQNGKALSFYQHMGFHETGRTQMEDGGASREVELVNFDELSHEVRMPPLR